MHHGEILKNNFHGYFVINDGLCLKLALCCEINAYMNDTIIQKISFLFAKPCHISIIPTKGLRCYIIFPLNFTHT
jgi:hypothetical protein